jgi:predicted AlkP superfamily phosphohydrolase/phosphomutase
VVFLLVLGLVAACVPPAEAYIGPGAGFAITSSLLVIMWTMLAAALTLLTWPLRWVIRTIRGRRAFAHAKIRRLVILGLDGMEPSLAERFMAEGRMPNLARLKARGSYRRLGTTTPPLSPVAWSTFLTGVNPGKHNIYDFLNAERRTYLPSLSSVLIRPPTRTMKIGRYEIPLNGPEIRMLRKGKPFWRDLGEHGIFTAVIRVPITFPPEPCRGVLLSAMCVPDLRGTQGMFSFYSTAGAEPGRYKTGTNGAGERTGGEQVRVKRDGNVIRAALIGPENSLVPGSGSLRVPFVVRLAKDGAGATLEVGGAKHPLQPGVYSDWITVRFSAGLGVKVNGICRFLLLATQPEFELYVTPINLDPQKPAMPIAYPAAYSSYLAKRFGAYATLGLAEDTWALNEHLIDDAAFLEQCTSCDAEREQQFFDALDNTSRGLVVCVFDGTDRIQHMFWRYLEPDHPARRNGTPSSAVGPKAIEDLYERMDALVGRTMEKVLTGDDQAMLMVISDHGFGSFRRGIDLNAWLIEHGYMRLKPDAERGTKYLAAVDWEQTRAYALGLAGMFINQKGREARGVVEPGAATQQLKREIVEKMTGMLDPQTNAVAVVRVHDREDVYHGPYRDGAPDLIIGYNRGYRVAWDTAIGKVTPAVFHDNARPWSGDHCIEPELIPGVLFCSHKVLSESPRLMDLAPTALDLFGVPVPPNYDGRPLVIDMGSTAAATGATQ